MARSRGGLSWKGNPPSWYVGKWIKTGFVASESSEVEHMWVHVKATTQDGKLVGALDNEPVVATRFKRGDVVILQVDGVEEVMA